MDASPSITEVNNDNFFHSAFGVRTNDNEAYFDKHAQHKRKNYEVFLTYFRNEIMPSSLKEALEKYFSTNDKYKHKPFQENFDKYITDFAKGQVITMEEIPILATLENIEIAVVSTTTPNSKTIITPNKEILGDYPYGCAKRKEKVALRLQEGIFSRIDEKANPNIHKKPLRKCGENEFEKGPGAGGGIQYQIALLVIFLLNAFPKLKKWKLSTENKKAGKFDDVVIQCPKGDVLLQSKFKENKKITLDDLTSDNSDKDDFSLAKYFLHYQKTKDKFKIRNVIICTNTTLILDKDVNDYVECQVVPCESMLHYEDGTCEFYKFKDKIIPTLLEKSKSYYNKNRKKIDIDESVITKENMKDFLKRLQFYYNYPQNRMEEVIEKLLFINKLQGKVSVLEITAKVMDWYHEKKGIFLTHIHASGKFSEIWRNRYYQTLEQYNVLFQDKNLPLENSKRIFHIVAEVGHLLYVLKIYRTLQDKNNTLYVIPNDSIDTQKLVVEVFRQLRHNFLIIIWPKTTEESVITEICRSLKDILFECKTYKKVIFVAEDNILEQSALVDDYVRITEFVTFQEFSKDTKERLLNQKSINFQMNKVNLYELFAPKTIDNYTEAVNLETIEKLVKGQEITVGAPPLYLEEQSDSYYIDRCFKRKIPNNADKENNNVRIEKTLSEKDIHDIDDKIVLIAGSSGIGNSTIINRFAKNFKKEHPELWVITMSLRNCTIILDQKNKKEGVEILELLDTKQTSHLEKAVFLLEGKVALFLDETNEICSNDTTLIKLLTHCHKSANFVKVFAAIKPRVAFKIENILRVKPFELQPFTRVDQKEYLERYWKHHLQQDKKKCKDNAETVIDKMLPCMNFSYDFAGIPLHAKILADIATDWNIELFRDSEIGIKSNGTESKFTENVTSYHIQLIDSLTKRKQDDFIKKINSRGSEEVNPILVEYFNRYLQIFALEKILNKEKCNFFICHQQSDQYLPKNTLEMGTVQTLDDTFVCRTVAEHFCAKNLYAELQYNRKEDFQRFFIEEILMKSEYKTIRVFFNHFLQTEGCNFSIYFKNSLSLPAQDMSNLICQLKEENCKTISQFVKGMWSAN